MSVEAPVWPILNVRDVSVKYVQLIEQDVVDLNASCANFKTRLPPDGIGFLFFTVKVYFEGIPTVVIVLVSDALRASKVAVNLATLLETHIRLPSTSNVRMVKESVGAIEDGFLMRDTINISEFAVLGYYRLFVRRFCPA